MAVFIALLGILGTLAATLIAQRGERKRRAEERNAALQRERRDAVRDDYREILRFIAHTRLFVNEMKRRLVELPEWNKHASSDAREVEDLEARAEMLRRRFLDDLPDVQALVEAWGTQELIDIFDDIDDYGVRIKAATTTYLHFKYKGERIEDGHAEAIKYMDELVSLLTRARDAIKSELTPREGGA